MNTMPIDLAPLPQDTSPISLVAIVAAGPERLASMLAAYQPIAPAHALVFNAASCEVPLLQKTYVKTFSATLSPTAAHGEAELICHSLPGLFSLRESTDVLRDIFPGLQEIKRRKVPRHSFVTLVEELGDTADMFTMIVDFPGEEAALLSQIESYGLLERIERLRLRCGSERFFEGAMTADELEAWVTERFFTLAQRDTADSAWPVLDFIADPQRRRIATLERNLVDREAALEKATMQVSELTAGLHAAEAQLHATQRVLEAEQKARSDQEVALDKVASDAAEVKDRLLGTEAHMQEALAAAEATEKALADREAALEKATMQVSELTAGLHAAEAQLHATQRVLEAEQKARSDHDVALDKVASDAAEVKDRLLSTEAHMQEALAAAEATEKALADREAALEKATIQVSELTGRLHALTEEARRLRLGKRNSEELAQRARAEFDRMFADHALLLTMLQSRADELTALGDSHGRLSNEKRALEELLGKLTPRLQEATAQLQSLALLPAESETDAST